MHNDDKFNLKLVHSQEEVDELNKEFYSKFNYPWPPMAFEYFSDQKFVIKMLNQDLGSWEHSVIPSQPKIWVAGCGTNQAIYTAIKFPDSEVLGTDISAKSLETCRGIADQIGIKNLELKEESINKVNFKEEFDYILCTGVIHHNANPAISLEKLAQALKPDGVIELMVYNYYHRLLTTAFQKAIRILTEKKSIIEFDSEISTAKKLIEKFPLQNLMSEFLSNFKIANDSFLADSLLQPVEYSYTIESLEEMLSICDLEYLTPCFNQFNNKKQWNINFKNSEISDYYESFTDTQRWQIGNLLMFEESPPMIWFYLHKKESIYKRKSEKQICDEFLNQKFDRTSTLVRQYVCNDKGEYKLNPKDLSYPSPLQPSGYMEKLIYNSTDRNIPMKDILNKLKIDMSFYNINRIRLNLTTLAFPYLQAINRE